MIRGVIFDIQRFSLHDGPGIRTAVFLKGCDLRCGWCQNPEGLQSGIRLWHFENRCAGCGECLSVCPANALTRRNGRFEIAIARDLCSLCGDCVAACPSGALAFDGREAGVEEVLAEVVRDIDFYTVSGGGITITGGEPLLQPKFCGALLRGCREQGISTAIETALAAPEEVVAGTAPLADLLLVDLKLASSEDHEYWTGLPNGAVRRGFERVVATGANVIVRVPLIPEATATVDNLRGIARYVRSVSESLAIELVNFNPLARAKYRRLGIDWRFAGYHTLPEEEVDRMRQAIREEGVEVH